MAFDWIDIAAGGPVSYVYSIMRDPVTNGQYCEFLRSLPAEEAKKRYCSLMEDHFFGGIMRDYSPKPGFDKKPVVFVSWFDAQVFGKWVGGRLPTVDEWRKAAAWQLWQNRYAGYCTGQGEMPTQTDAIFYDDEDGWALPAPHLADVDWYRPSGAYGIRGMAGNVSEWVDGEMANGWKMALGGSVFRPVDQMRIDAVEGDRADKRLSTFGFRLAKAV